MDSRITPEQCRAARGLLGISQMQLCELAGITHKPLVDFERGKTKPYASTLERICAALEGQGVNFTDGDSPGVRLRKGLRKP